MKINDFQNDLVYSLDKRDDEFLQLFYSKIFPNLEKIEVVENLDLQKKGIDKIIHLKSGKDILIDEKKRRKTYSDILIEEYSNFDAKIPGWLHSSKYTDYIVYVFMDTGTIYLLPFWLLNLSFRKNYKKWLEEYGRIFVQNRFYKTSNIPVPIDVLLESINVEMKQNQLKN